MNVLAPCLFDDCADCASRQILHSDSSLFSCHGGLDAATLTYTLPCHRCCPPTDAATQDLDQFELDAFLETAQIAQDIRDMDERELGTLLFGDEDDAAQRITNDIFEQQERWPKCSIPCTRQETVNMNGVNTPFRFYKPFQRLMPEERDDFKAFLDLIF